MSSYPTPEIFRNYPELRQRLPWVPLVRATQVERLTRIESYLHAASLWVKRDDQTSDVYGGDKPRKLEFVFGDVLRTGARRMVAFGGVGSGHCLAVTTFAHHFRIQAVLALARRHDGHDVQRSLQIEHELGAELHRLDGGPMALVRLLRSLLRRTDDDDSQRPYVLWPRRAALFGALGYVNAAYELKRQINVGILPEPERIYVPATTGATAAGLALGCQLAQIRSTIVAVANARGTRARPAALAERTARLLRRQTRRIPARPFGFRNIEMRHDFTDSSLGNVAAHQARGLLRDLENIELDSRHGSPALAALMHDVRAGTVTGPVLFWHTQPANALARQTTVSADALPREFREFFAAR